METGTVKTSAIVIAAGDGTQVYRTLDEVPPVLRRKLLRSTAGSNAGIVIIADRRGAEELLRARGAPDRPKSAVRKHRKLSYWAGLLLSTATGGILWLLYHGGW